MNQHPTTPTDKQWQVTENLEKHYRAIGYIAGYNLAMIKDTENNIQKLWEMHTDAQEQILRSHAIPISIIPDSAKISGGKVTVKADETNKIDSLIEAFSQWFGVKTDELSNGSGYFYVDKDSIPSSEIRDRLSSTAEECHIKFRPNPVIDGTISSNDTSLKSFTSILVDSSLDYSFDSKGRLQIALSDLDKLNAKLEDVDNINLNIPETASAIFQLTPSPVYFLKKKYPNINWSHRTIVIVNKPDNELKFLRTIEVENGYIGENLLTELSEIVSLRLTGYEFEFHVPEEIRNTFKIDPQITFPQFDSEKDAYVVKITVKESTHDDENGREDYFFDDINYTYTFYLHLFSRYFGKENVQLKSSRFYYKYNLDDYMDKNIDAADDWKDDFWESQHAIFNGSGISVSRNAEAIGIDFNWKRCSIQELVSSIHEASPDVIISYYSNHKCNIDLHVQDKSLDKAEQALRENFPSIQVIRNDWNGDIYFYQEYNNLYQHDRIYTSLQRQIDELELDEYTIVLNDIPAGKEKFIFRADKAGQRESQIEIIQSLRGKDFCIGSEVKIGRLIRISYPLLTFALDDNDKDRATEAFRSNSVHQVIPDITGDLEKIYRLKNSFKSIITGKGLRNNNLSEFIFDATKAKPINEVDSYIDEHSEYYREISSHLLNERINNSQKQAIIKTLLAEDLALIQGPPGTGKSTAIAEIIWQHIRKNSNERILLTSETNLAVDNAIDRIVNTTHNLVKPIRIGDDAKLVPEGRQFSLEALKLWVENGIVKGARRGFSDEGKDEETNEDKKQKIILENWTENILRRANKDQIGDIAFESWCRYLSKPSKETRTLIFNQYIHHCNVIGATCSSIGEKNTKGTPTSFFRCYCELFGKVTTKTGRDGKEHKIYNGNISFDTVIQDESSKATPAELSLPLIYGKKNIIIGDHRQLPPLLAKDEFISSLDYMLRELNEGKERHKVQRLKAYVEDHFDEMEISHFQRLFENISPTLRGVFNRQYRMHWAINDAIAQFYEEDGGLECGLDKEQADNPDISNPNSRYHGIEINGLIKPTDHIIWLDTETPEIDDGTSKVNFGEIEVVRAILNEFKKSDSFQRYLNLWKNDEDKQIGLISFYGKQIKYLWELSKEFPTLPMEVNTVDRFQGMERNIIIVSMVRSSCKAADKEQLPDHELYGERGYPKQNTLGFAQSPNRLNVALSRAKRLLIIIGNSELFRQKRIYDNVYNTIKNSKCGNIIKCDSKWIGKRL